MKGQKRNWLTTFWWAITIGLGFYWSLWADSVSSSTLATTLILGLAAATLAIPLGGLWSAGIWQGGTQGGLLLALAVFGATVPLYIQVSAWDSAFGKLGWLSILGGNTLTPQVSRWAAAIWIHAVAATPQVALIVSAGGVLARGEFEEQGLLDASGGSVFWHLTLRRLMPFVAVSAFWIILTCSREIAVADIYQIGTLAEQIYLGYSLGTFDSFSRLEFITLGGGSLWPSLLTLGWLGVGLLGWRLRAESVDRDLAPGGGGSEPSSPSLSGVASPPCSWFRRTAIGGLLPYRLSLVGAWMVILTTLFLPVSSLLVRIGVRVVESADGPRQEYSFAESCNVLLRAVSEYRTEFGWSAAMGISGAVVFVTLGVVGSQVAVGRRVGRALFFLLLLVAACLPGPLIGSLLLEWTQHWQMPAAIWLSDRTLALPVIASGVFLWPIIGLLSWELVSQVNRQLLQQASLEGAGFWRRLHSITLGGRWRWLTGLLLLIAVLFFGELSAAQLLIPPGMDTLPRLTLGLMHSGVDEMTAAISLWTGVIMTVVILTSFCLVQTKLD